MGKRRILWRISAVSLSVACAAAASAQTFDHLSCRRITGGLDLGTAVDIDALDDRFDSKTCQLGEARLVCGPAARTAVDPTPPLAFVQGQDLPSDYLCYRLECDRKPAPVQLTDLFGNRLARSLRSDLLCVPAVRSGGSG